LTCSRGVATSLLNVAGCLLDIADGSASLRVLRCRAALPPDLDRLGGSVLPDLARHRVGKGLVVDPNKEAEKVLAADPDIRRAEALVGDQNKLPALPPEPEDVAEANKRLE
jgi:hypothetical protein